ncbi:acyl-CoA dehydrogenase family protein [Sphingomonas zeae]|jgi:acyl-CoA dehydrogenase|uniref:Acyl-CoA dehydrogenase n=1 Tax=Sphingomonas zeae TaxID=1646122 RepID=A0A7Y6B1P8_9SPHN|nr:acyl-CoA dehydrogenase family protein [Sphingomonas zeae]MBB4049686.1 acyl-CoA dehydrogenase [Sphingomonas zeae]NUU45822.1 acyl-CoA dehydrogenase [Sphingomonas zeae]
MGIYRSPWLDEELDQWRESVRSFCEDTLAPNEGRFNAQGFVDRDVWRQAGEIGILGADIPADLGGVGGHFGFSAIAAEEMARVGANSFRVAVAIHVIAAHYLAHYGSDEQRRQWLPGLCDGSKLAGVAMSEPGGGSDLQGMKTRAVLSDGQYAVSGSKIFITNGSQADLLVVAAKTNPEARARGISMMLLDTSLPGFSVGRRLEKVGLHASDTCELFFDNCLVQADALLGKEEGLGFIQMMEQLAYERVIAAVGCVANMEQAYVLARDYAAERRAFGKALTEMQHVRFELADIKTDVLAARTFLDHIITQMISGSVDAELASMGKYWTSEKLGQVADRCVQIFGGYGYMTEYPVARLYADARVERIYGGTTEIMKEIISRTL